MKTRNWGFAAGLAAALAYGTAAAQSPGTGNQMGGTGQEQGATGRDTTGTEKPGERSGWSGSEANRTGTATPPVAGSERDTSATAGSTGSARAGSTAATSGQKVDKKLEEKLQKIHAANQAELQFAQLGVQQAQSPEVKQYAEMLQKDHQRMDQQLTQAAESTGAQLQGKAYDEEQKDAQKELEKLQKKTGQDFDKAYMSHMVKDHEKDLKEVKSAAKDAQKGNHTELASMLDQAARGIEGHRDQAEQIEKSLKNQKSTARSGAATGGSTGSSTSTDTGSTGSAGTSGVTPQGGAPGTSSDHRDTSRGDTGRGQQPGQEPAQEPRTTK